MANKCKYYKEKQQVSYDFGVTWVDTGDYRKGNLIEYQSSDCQPSFDKQYLTFVAGESGTFTFTPTPDNTIYYSLDDGETWTQGNSVSVSSYDTVMWKGNMTPNSNGIGTFSSSGNFEALGNPMSLLYGDNFSGQTSLSGKDYAFSYLFLDCTYLQSIGNLVLPATTLSIGCYFAMFGGCTSLTSIPSNLLLAMTLANNCYRSMFGGCTSLTTVPSGLLQATTLANNCYYSMFYNCRSLTTVPSDLLPATTLAPYCYNSMFYYCTSLTTAPNLPATTLKDSCYNQMFYRCTSLTTAPNLPAMTLTDSCYNQMFYGCTNLTTVPSDLLPATTLANECYDSMFYGCSSLTEAPELPATTLEDYCYSFMFHDCSNLNSITCLATDISASYCTSGWVFGVAASGTFVTPSSTNWATGESGIPNGWTRVNV